MEIGLSLGSNMGDRLANMREAKRRIAAIPGAVIIAQSPVYETSPVDVGPEFSDLLFLNAVLIVESEPAPEALLDGLGAIECALGRKRGPGRNAPRPIDVDIIYADCKRIRTARLTIPHPRWAERRFVVRPLADVRPDLKLPGRRRTVAQRLLALPAGQKVVPFARKW